MPPKPPQEGSTLRRTLTAYALTMSALFVAAGLLYGWVGGGAVATFAEKEELARERDRFRSALVTAADDGATEALIPLLMARAAAERVAEEAGRSGLADGGRASGLPEDALPPLRIDAEQDCYIASLSVHPDDAARLDRLAAALAPALRTALSPSRGAARIAVRLPGLGEIGAPASFAATVSSSPAERALLERSLRADFADQPLEWLMSDDGQPGFAAPLLIRGIRAGFVRTVVSEKALTTAIDEASSAVKEKAPGGRVVLLSSTGHVMAAATGTGELVNVDDDAAGITLERILGAGPGFVFGGKPSVREIRGGLLAVNPVPALGCAVAVVAPGPPEAHAPLAAAAAARGFGWGVAVLSAAFGAALYFGLRRSTASYEKRTLELTSAAAAHARGGYERTVEVSTDAPVDDELAALGLWLNSASLRIRSAQSRAEEADRRFTSLIQSMADGFVMTDADDRITFMNDRLAALLGVDAAAPVGRFVEEFVLPDSLQRYRSEVAKRKDRQSSRYELAWATRAGGRVRTIVSGVPAMDDQGRFAGAYAVVTDITDPVRAHQEIARAEKLRALGEMAGGIAHDFNNVLTVVVGNSQYLLGEDLPAPAHEMLRAIENAAMEGTETVRRLREFTRIRNVSVAADSVDPVAAVRDALEDVRTRMSGDWAGRAVRFDVNMSGRSRRRIRGNAAELRESLVHVIENAVEAMPGGGALSVEVFDRGEDAVAIRIEDTGCGIPEERLPKIFDPFFTTKEGGRCAGLGLSIAYGIVRAHRGRLDVKSVVGRGTTVTVVLPARLPTAEDVAPVRPAMEPRVLLAGPPAVTSDLQASLRALGMHVATVNSSAAAAELLHDRGIFNILVVENEWNRRAGWNLARQARLLRDDLRILLLAEPHDSVSESQARNAGIDRLVVRPFDGRDIHAEIFAMMASAPARVSIAAKPFRKGATTVRDAPAPSADEVSREIWGAVGTQCDGTSAGETGEVEITVVEAPAEPSDGPVSDPIEETFVADSIRGAEEEHP